MTMTADTFGWDTVYAIKYADVNTSIAKDWPSPALAINQTSGPASISGDFAPWQITSGGSGHLVRMTTPVPVLVYNGNTSNPYNATVTIEVQLEFIPQPPSSVQSTAQSRGMSGGQWHDLRLGAGPDAVSIIKIDYTGTAPSALDQSYIRDLFRQWFITPANLQDFNIVFATVNLNDKADVGALSWLYATAVGYAVAEESSLPDGIFAVLAMTEGRPATGLAHQVSPYAIPTGERSALLISAERYLSKMLMPGIGLMFAPPANPGSKSWPRDYFELDSAGTTITNLESLTVPHLQIDDSNTVAATVAPRQFAVRVDGNALVIDFTNLQHDYKPHVLQWLQVNHTIHATATASLRHGNQFALDASSGEHTVVVTKTEAADWAQFVLDTATLLLMTTGLVVTGVRAATVGAAVETTNTLTRTVALRDLAAAPDAVSTADATAGATGCLSAIGGRVVAAKNFLQAFWQSYRATYFALASTITGIAAGIEEALTWIAGKTSQNDLSNFDQFAGSVMAPVQWPNTQSEFTATAVAFNGSFQISGNPGFAD